MYKIILLSAENVKIPKIKLPFFFQTNIAKKSATTKKEMVTSISVFKSVKNILFFPQPLPISCEKLCLVKKLKIKPEDQPPDVFIIIQNYTFRYL